MVCDNPVFIVGTERSGSNLLRQILNCHTKVSVPHPPHIMRYFSGIEHLYGDLSAPRNFRRLATDVVNHVHRHIHPWPSPIAIDQLIGNVCQKSLLGLCLGIYDQHLDTNKKPVWGCKSTFMVEFAEEILETRPGARFIWLVRDPRDVALSSRDSVFNPYHPYYTARLWKRQQEMGRNLWQRYGHYSVLKLHYEDLLRDSRTTIRKVCEFVGVDFEPGILHFFRTPSAATTSNLAFDWENLRVPILRGNFNKYTSGLTKSEIEIVESETADLMDFLGYPRVFDSTGTTRLTRLKARVKNEMLRIRVEWRSLHRSDNHWIRWHRSVRMGLLRAKMRFLWILHPR